MYLSFGKYLILAVSGLIFVFLYCVVQSIYNVYFHPLRKYPGPKLWAATRLVWVYHEFKGDLIFRIKDIHERYGPVVRIAPDELGFTNSAAWKDIYGKGEAGSKQLARDPYIFPPELPQFRNGIIYADDKIHSRIRRQVAYAFSTRVLEEQQPLIKSHIDVLIKKLHQSSKPEDLATWFNFIGFDIIADLAFGQQFRCLENGLYPPFASTIVDAFKIGIFRSALNRYGLLPLWARLLPSGLIRKRNAKIAMTRELIRNRLESKTDRPDFISFLLKAEENDRTMTPDEIMSNATAIIIGGSESVGSSLAGTVYYLLRSPGKLAKATQEVRSAFKHESEISMSTVSRLPYTLACLEEGLRVATPAPFGLARRTSEPTAIGGHLVPANTSVSVPQFAAWHMSSNFARPEEFLPERWLSDDPEFVNDTRTRFYPFSTGPRNCIGKNLAYLEMRLILAHLFRNFDLELADRIFEWTKQKSYIVWEKLPLMVSLKSVR